MRALSIPGLEDDKQPPGASTSALTESSKPGRKTKVISTRSTTSGSRGARTDESSPGGTSSHHDHHHHHHHRHKPPTYKELVRAVGEIAEERRRTQMKHRSDNALLKILCCGRHRKFLTWTDRLHGGGQLAPEDRHGIDSDGGGSEDEGGDVTLDKKRLRERAETLFSDFNKTQKALIQSAASAMIVQERSQGARFYNVCMSGNVVALHQTLMTGAKIDAEYIRQSYGISVLEPMIEQQMENGVHMLLIYKVGFVGYLEG